MNRPTAVISQVKPAHCSRAGTLRVLYGGLVLPGILIMLGYGSLAQAEIVYKYKDKYGRTVFTDIPQTTDFVMIEINPKGWSDPSRSLGLSVIKARMEQYKHLVERAAREFGLPVPLLNAVIAAESAYNPKAVSSAGAMGLMQLMPDTARQYGVENAFVPGENIRGGARYLRYLMGLFHGNLNLVLAAYNAGEGTVKKYGNAIPPYPETHNYVRKVKQYKVLLGEGITQSLAQSG